jgi:hypothetical protein
MTERTAQIFDMTPFITAEIIPTDPTTGNPMVQTVMTRGDNAIWRCRTEPIRLEEDDGPLAWSLIREGQIVRIPLLPYRSAPGTTNILVGGMDIIQRYLDKWPNPVRTHIVVGDPVETMEDGNLRFWLGFAVRIK